MGADLNLFSSMTLGNWRQFAEVEIPLSSPCVVLTGVNGSGKTTLLTILAKHFGWNLPFISTPLIGKRRMKRLYSDIYDDEQFSDEADIPSGMRKVGDIKYENGSSCQLTTEALTGANYHLNYQGIQNVTGLYIPSHRPSAVYAPVSTIPTNPVELSQLYQNYFSILSQSMTNAGRVQNPSLIQKENIIALAVFGENTEHVDANPHYIGRINEFEEVLKKALPSDLGFRSLKIRTPDVVLKTDSGEFSIDSMSGGINALFTILWQIYSFSIGKDEFVVAIDEPENHLHPSMQRMFLPNVVSAFPQVRFVVATHSPFVVSSFSGAQVISLQRDPDRGQRIYSEVLSAADLSASPNGILRDVLKVGSTLPYWVEERIKEILEQTASMPNEERGMALMQALEDLGIGDAIAEYGVDE